MALAQEGLKETAPQDPWELLRAWILDLELRGIRELLLSGKSYFVATFGSSKRRDRALRVLRETPFISDGHTFPLKVEPFGAAQQSGNPGWIVEIPRVESTNCWVPFLLEEFQRQKIPFPGLTVAPVIFRGIRSGHWFLRFDDRPAKFIKSFVACGGKYLINEEKKRCRGCDQSAGHSFWDCDQFDRCRIEKEQGFKLKPGAKVKHREEDCGVIVESDSESDEDESQSGDLVAEDDGASAVTLYEPPPPSRQPEENEGTVEVISSDTEPLLESDGGVLSGDDSDDQLKSL